MQAELFGAISFELHIARKLSAYGRLMPIHQRCYLGLMVSVLHEDINKISLNLVRVLIGHCYFDLQE